MKPENKGVLRRELTKNIKKKRVFARKFLQRRPQRRCQRIQLVVSRFYEQLVGKL